MGLDNQTLLSLLLRYRREGDEKARDELIASFNLFLWKLANAGAKATALEPDEFYHDLYLKACRILNSFDIENHCEIRSYVMKSVTREKDHLVNRYVRRSRRFVEAKDILPSISSAECRSAPEQQDAWLALKRALHNAFAMLSKMERRILRLKFGMCRTGVAKSNAEIAKIVRMSRPWVSQILNKAIDKLQRNPQILRIRISFFD